MAFYPIKETLANWSKSSKFNGFFQDQNKIRIVNEYLQEVKHFSGSDVRASAWRKDDLFIKCRRSVLASEIKMEEFKLRDFFNKKIPHAKINKIFYRIG